VLKVRVVHRTRQTLKDDDVVHEEDLGRVQFTEGIKGTSPCDRTYARDVQVSLKVGDATHRLGRTSATGQLNVDLSGGLKQSLYGEETPPDGTLFVQWQGQGGVHDAEVGTLSLSELQRHEQRVDQLLEELRVILEKDLATLTPGEIAKSYELYEQLRQLNTGDARISALQARFLELFFERKRLERSANFVKNLKALNEAKDILRSQSPLIPYYVELALSASEPPNSALHWARGQVLSAARSTALCQGAFAWSGLGSYSPTTQFAFKYLQYAYGDGFESEVSHVCGRVTGW
jgi:hypothetical protein